MKKNIFLVVCFLCFPMFLYAEKETTKVELLDKIEVNKTKEVTATFLENLNDKELEGKILTGKIKYSREKGGTKVSIFWEKVGDLRVKEIISKFKDRIRLSTPVKNVKREKDSIKINFGDKGENEEIFDVIVFATHSDQSLEILEKPTKDEVEILGSIKYQNNNKGDLY